MNVRRPICLGVVFFAMVAVAEGQPVDFRKVELKILEPTVSAQEGEQ